jgi:hypothetical protein
VVGKQDEKRTLSRSKRRRDDNINIDLMEIELDGVYWTYLAEDRVHCKAVLNRLVP